MRESTVEISGAASRTAGTSQELAGWVQRADERSFVFLHSPPEPVAALVVCSPVGGEADTNRRREVLLARTLAERGIAVLRHDYRGTGNSDGEAPDLCFESMVEDTLAAVGLLSDRAGCVPAVLGTRLGALVAAAAVRAGEVAGLALWQPCRDGRSYYRELGLLRQMNKLAQQANRSVEETRSIKDELAAAGMIELAGYELHSRLYDSTIGLSLAELEPPAATPTLVIEFDAAEPSGWLRTTTERWRDGGVDCRAHAIPERENWWFANDLIAEEGRPLTRAVIDTTAEWLASLTRGTAEAAS
jgi:alpha/beta superfamily hydrolase